MGRHDVKLGGALVFDHLRIPAKPRDQKIFDRMSGILAYSEADLIVARIESHEIGEDVFAVELTVFDPSIVSVAKQIVHSVGIEIRMHELVCDRIRGLALDNVRNELNIEIEMLENMSQATFVICILDDEGA